MRLPADEAEAISLIRYAVDQGVNYLDTAYLYGRSEQIVGKALEQGYREKVVLATKSPLWHIKAHANFEDYLDQQLARLKTDYLDIYLLHNLYTNNLKRAKLFDAFGFLDDMIEKGKIRFKGFSLHNTFEAFQGIVEDYYWDMAQIQLNILDEDQQVGLRGLHYGAALDLAMVIMEPLRGGTLITNAPAAAKALVAAHPAKRSLADWCFRWLYDKPEISVILSGASTLEQLKENLRIFDDSAPGSLSGEERDFLEQLKAAYRDAYQVGCTGCGYCMPCSRGVDIPQILRAYDQYLLSERTSVVDRMYYQRSMVEGERGADRCVACDSCVQRCPQSLAVPTFLKAAHEALSAPFGLKGRGDR
jgi:predicted aldo/keto reductase-like oxidoreductase